MGITGTTTSKLFKVKTTDLTDPYKVGVNGVISISDVDLETKKVTYVIDEIRYSTKISVNLPKGSFNELPPVKPPTIGLTSKKISNERNSQVSVANRGGTKSVKFFKLDTINGTELKRSKTPPLKFNIDPNTEFVTNTFSYNNFTITPIYKESDYVGLIGKPIIKSEIFMERDKGSVFERHQRLSEINSINELETYRNGYYENINTI
jgi:hypothetical protein